LFRLTYNLWIMEMVRTLCAALLFLCGCLWAFQPLPHRERKAATLVSQVDALLKAHPNIAHGRLGLLVVDLENGAVLADENSAHFFTPASNAKLFTTAAALVRLGPEYRFRTVARATPDWRPGDPTVRELRVVGGGDPNLSGRVLPFSKSVRSGPPLSRIGQLADQIFEAGIRVVSGDVVAVDSRYPSDPYPDGWTLNDYLWDYGAPVSSFSVNDNSVQLIVTPTEPGSLASVELTPEVGHYVVLNQVVTVAGRKDQIEILRDPGSEEIVVRGEIGREVGMDAGREADHDVRRHQEDLAVNDAALFAAQALAAALRDRGVAVLGSPRAERSETAALSQTAGLPGTAASGEASGPATPPKPPGDEVPEVASLQSAPLSEIIAVVNKVSQNLHAEMLLRELGFAGMGAGTQAVGVAARKAFLAEAGVTEKETGYVLEDGSGLARQDLITPQSTVALLRYMWTRPEREAWLASLPIGGVDGSLEHRMTKLSHAERIHAKTGSLSHVVSLSGYAERLPGRWLAFSILINGATAPPREVSGFLDQVCALMLDESR
jgi:D-alanyl-D-alanine carboxypeptidase/D-alanyl-D-alanine-endopeptidase (penicillin-binding protein 4)